MSASLLAGPRARVGLQGWALVWDVVCLLLAARVPPSPGAGAASVLPPWVWAEGEGAKVHILRGQAQEVRAGTESYNRLGARTISGA